MKKFLLTILSLVALVATGYTTESRAATADALAVVKMTPESGSTVPNIYEILIEFNKEVWYDFMTGYQPVLKNEAGETVVTFGLDYPGYTGMHQGTFGNSYLSKNVLLYGGPITTPGTYTLRIYGDSIKTDDLSEVFPRTEYTFTIGGEAPALESKIVSVDPAEGEVASLKTITIMTDADMSGKPAGIVMKDEWGVEVPSTYKLTNDWHGVIFTTDAEVTEPGKYTIYIPEGAIYPWDNPAKKNAATQLSWTVTGAKPAITASWSMTEGQTVETFSEVALTFANVDAAKVKNSYGCYYFYEKDAEGAWQLVTNSCAAGYLDVAVSGTTLTFSVDPSCYSKDFQSPFSRKGEYRIVIPAGDVYFNGDKTNVSTEEYVLNFTIENNFVEAQEIEAAFTAEPANNSTISELKEIVVTFTDYASITVADPDFVAGSNIPQVLITDPDFGMTMPAGYIMARAGAAANQLVLYVDPQYTGGMESFTVPGAYTVMVPAGVVKFGQDTNKAFELNYTVQAEVAPVEQVVTFDFAAIYGTDASISNLQDSTPLNVDGFTMTFAKGNGSGGVVYNKEGNIRLNGSSTSQNANVEGNTVTITAPEGKIITSMVFNPGTTYANYTILSADQGTFTSQGNNVAAYWDGFASTVVVSACRNKFNPSQAKTGRYASVVINYVLDTEAVLKTAQYSLNGDNTDTFKGIDVTFNKDVQAVSALFGGGQTVIKNAAGETMGTCFLTAKGNKINAEYSDKLAAGNYSLVFPANTIKTTDGSIVLPETAIDFTIKAAKLDATVTFTTSPILASTGNATVKFDCSTTNVEFLCTYDGSEPTPDSYSNAGTSKQRNISLSSAKKDSICTVTIRVMTFDGVLSDCFTQKVFAHYGATLDFYRGATTMAAGNYLMTTPATIAYGLDASKTYGYLPSVDVATNNGVVQAYNYFDWTFEATDGGYYMKDSQGRYYYMTGNYDSFNISETVPTEGGVWAVTMNADGTAQVMNVAKQKYIQYNANYGTWGVYADAKGTMPTLAKVATPELVITPDMNGTRIPYNVQEMTFYCADGITLGSRATSSYVMDRKNGTRYEYTFETVDANTIKLALKEALPTGDYTLSLYKQAFTLGAGVFDMAVPASTTAYQFSIVNPYEVTVTPSNDSYVEKLDTLTFSNELGLVIDNLFEGDAPSLSYNNGEETVTVKLVVANTTANAISFVPETALTTETAYTLNVAEGYFLVGEEQEAAPAIKKEYQLIFPVVIVSSTPAEGSSVEQFSEIVVEFNKLVNVAAAETYESYYVVDPAGNKTELTAEMIDPTEISVTSYGYTQTYTVAKKARFYAPEVLTAEGAYKVVFGNAFGGGDIVDMVNSVSLANNTTINFEVKVLKLEVVATTPAEGEEVEQFTEMTVQFSKPVYDQSKDATLYKADGTKVATLKKEILDNVGSHAGLFGSSPLFTKVRYYVETAVTEDGGYYVQIPTDAFATDDNSEWSTKVKVNFTVKAKEVTPTIAPTWSIEEGAELKGFTSVDVTFSGVDAVKSTSMYPYFFWEKNAEGQWQQVENGCAAGVMDASASGNTLTLAVDLSCYSDDYVSPFSRNGEYRIIIPAGGIYFNGDKTNKNTEEYVLNFTIKGEPQPGEIDAAFTADPANNSTIDALGNVVLTFTEYTSIEVAELDMAMGSNIPMVYMVDDMTGMSMPAGYIFFRAGAAANQLELYVDPNFNGGYPSYNLAGQYKVVIPKKVVKFNNGVSKEITLNYTVTGSAQGKQLNVTGSTPANGATVEVLSEVVVDWNMNITIPGEDAIEAYVEDVHGIVRSTVKASLTGLAGNQIRYVLESPISEAGMYNLIIPMGDVLDFDTESIVNEDVALTFMVAPAAQGIEVVSSNPIADSIVESLETITVEFNKAVGYDGYFEKARLEVDGKVIANVKEVTYVDGDQWSAQTLVFTLEEKVTEANVYQFIIPAKSITDASDWMTMMDKDVVLYFTIGAAQVDEILIVSSTPADGEIVSREFTEMFVTFNTGVFVFITPIVYDATGLEVSNTTQEFYDANGEMYPDNVAHLKLTTPLGKGTYEVVFEANSICTYPEMYMYNDKEFRIKVTVDPTGINGIAADPVNGYVVYDLNGFRVMQTMNAADLDRLNNGLYIINGVKVLINK